MGDGPKLADLATGRLGRFASLARAGLGSAASMALGSSSGVERAVETLGELRGIGTKVGQMAGIVEAHLDPEMRAKVGPALARLRAQAAASPYEAIEATLREDFGAEVSSLFREFERVPFASASLGQVHRAVLHDGTDVAVKVQHPGIDVAFRGDLENVGSFGRIAASFVMPDDQGPAFVEGVKEGFLAELDYRREATNLQLFGALLEGDPELATPALVPDRSSARVLSTTFLAGHPVERAREADDATRLRQAAAVRRLVVSSLADHGVLYADAHPGNFLFRDDGTVGVLDFGSVFRFEEPLRDAFGALRDAALTRDRAAFERGVERAYGVGDRGMITHIANVQWLSFGGLVRGDAIDDGHVRSIAAAAKQLKRQLLGSKVRLPHFLPFLIRTLLATNALLAALAAPASGPVGRLQPGSSDAKR